jgi:excisionase family DNA binding protein
MAINPSPLDRLLRDHDVAAKLGVTVRTIISWRHAGRLPHMRIGRGVFYKQASIDTMLAALERGGNQP